MQSSGTSVSSELLQLIPLHSVHTSLHCRPCCRHVPLQSMQSSGTSGSSELLQLVHLHSVHTSLHCRPGCRHVHLFVLHSFLQLQDMMSSSSAGAAGLSVCIGRHFPSTMCTTILLASYCHLFLSSTLHDSTIEGCGTLQPLRSLAEYLVPHAMCLYTYYHSAGMHISLMEFMVVCH